MAKKKSSAKSKKTTKNVVKANDIDINNIDSMFEDMKKLVLDNEKKTQPIEEYVTEFNVVGENAENTTIEAPYVLETENVETIVTENETLTDEETTTEVQEEIEEVVETTENEEAKQEENQENEENEIIIDDSSNEDIDKLKEELDKEEEQKEQETKQQEEEKPKENKRRRMTYEEVFGHRWMGYGYTSYT